MLFYKSFIVSHLAYMSLTHFEFLCVCLHGVRKCSKFIILHVSACMLSHFSHAHLFVTLCTVAHQDPLSMRFPRKEYWSGLAFFFSPGDLPNSGIGPMSPMSPELAGKFFNTSATCSCQVFQFSQHHLLKRLYLLYSIFWPHCHILGDHGCMSLILGLCILLCWSTFMFLCQYHTVLITVAL